MSKSWHRAIKRKKVADDWLICIWSQHVYRNTHAVTWHALLLQYLVVLIWSRMRFTAFDWNEELISRIAPEQYVIHVSFQKSATLFILHGIALQVRPCRCDERGRHARDFCSSGAVGWTSPSSRVRCSLEWHGKRYAVKSISQMRRPYYYKLWYIW